MSERELAKYAGSVRRDGGVWYPPQPDIPNVRSLAAVHWLRALSRRRPWSASSGSCIYRQTQGSLEAHSSPPDNSNPMGRHASPATAFFGGSEARLEARSHPPNRVRAEVLKVAARVQAGHRRGRDLGRPALVEQVRGVDGE